MEESQKKFQEEPADKFCEERCALKELLGKPLKKLLIECLQIFLEEVSAELFKKSFDELME